MTQIANPRTAGPDRSLFFADPNYAEGIYAINWLPIESQTLYLGLDPSYLESNWTQFLQDFETQQPTVGSTAQGVYELLVAAYQALLPDQGTGVNDPGPSNALLRLDPAFNPVIIPPAPDKRAQKRVHRHLTRTQALNWIYTLQQLGQVDPTVIANALRLRRFHPGTGCSRSFVAFNPGSSPLQVTFRDAQSSAVLAVLSLQPHQMVTQLPSGQLINDSLGQAEGGGAYRNESVPLELGRPEYARRSARHRRTEPERRSPRHQYVHGNIR